MIDTLKTLALVVAFLMAMEAMLAVALFIGKKPMPFWLRVFFKFPLSKFQWYRKWYGGRWELWYIDECMADIWFHEKSLYNGQRPMSSRGTPVIEDYNESRPSRRQDDIGRNSERKEDAAGVS